MSISEAIALVRRGATKASLDGALSVLGARLKSDVIPAPLRPLTTRLAALLGMETAAARHAARQQLEIVSLDRALVRASASNAQVPPLRALHSVDAAARGVEQNTDHAAGDVCPFTGLRADGTVAAQANDAVPLAEQPAAGERADEPPRLAPVADEFAEVHTGELLAVDVAAVRAAAESAPDVPSEVEARASTREQSPAAEPAKKRSRSHRRGGAKADGEKRKEKLAAANNVTNTSARSATRPAAKQPSGRGQTSSRKKA